MTRLFGIDTSVLVRLVTGDPENEFNRCVSVLTSMVDDGGAQLFVSNQAVGEAYIALQHHYGVSKSAARAVKYPAGVIIVLLIREIVT